MVLALPVDGDRPELPPDAVPVAGQLVTVRGRRWVVSDVRASSITAESVLAGAHEAQHLVTLTSVEDDSFDETLRVVWQVEVGARTHESSALPTLEPGQRLDDPETLDAFLDAVRWGALTSADKSLLQAPFRSGIDIEDYQLDPLVRALGMPRANLLIADDVGLGKTIEAGLVIQELILRYRARTVFIVCPASLCIQWREQMQDKFGLEFRVLDTELVRALRRERGVRVNPFTHYPRLIMSVDWLKRDRPMRLLRDVLPKGTPGLPRAFDLLVVDEVHSCAPTGRGRYATDSMRTNAIRELAPHCEHRLFLSATPHNGYQESFTALLELLDDQRFARGVPPDPSQLRRVMVRRLKSELPPDFAGRPRFPRRVVVPLEVDYGAEERRIHADLQTYAKSRIERAGGDRERIAVEFALTTLKKRLFSSPAAFARTLAVHRASILERAASGPRPAKRPAAHVSVLREAVAALDDALDTDEDDPTSYAATARRAFEAAASAEPALTDEESGLLATMMLWAEQTLYRDDSKLAVFVDWLDTVLTDGSRVIVFTEYRDTQRWLHEQLVSRGYGGGNQIEVLNGGVDLDERDRIKKLFQAPPDQSPIRILLATDAASEGIDLQNHCHRLVHWEIPWNPNRLEQRNGRVDRHGQRAAEVLIHHFVGAGYETAEPGSLDGDLQFLAQAIRKVEQIRTDLGSVGPVIADQVTEAMLGHRTQQLDTSAAEATVAKRALLKVERDLAAELERLLSVLQESRSELGLSPHAVERVVRTGLHLARQPALTPAKRAGEYTVPPLTEEWSRALLGIEHPISHRPRPVTFDADAARERIRDTEVVHLHLGHPLVQQCLRLLRAEVWAGGREAKLTRVSARVVDDDELAEPVALAHGRLVVTGASGSRLHEEVITAGGYLRQGRLTSFTTQREVRHALAASRGGGHAAPAELADGLIALLPTISPNLVRALERRRDDRQASLRRQLADTAAREADTAEQVLIELSKGIDHALANTSRYHQLSFFEVEERQQLERDVDALRSRLERIPTDIADAREAVRRRYADPTPRFFPVAMEFLVPRRVVR
jgi:superfamily II DNA or RNA helicase